MPGNVSAVHSGVRIDTNGSHADGKSPNNKQVGNGSFGHQFDLGSHASQ